MSSIGIEKRRALACTAAVSERESTARRSLVHVARTSILAAAAIWYEPLRCVSWRLSSESFSCAFSHRQWRSSRPATTSTSPPSLVWQTHAETSSRTAAVTSSVWFMAERASEQATTEKGREEPRH